MAINDDTQKTVRLFTGVTPPPGALDDLAVLMEALKCNDLADIRWEQPHNLHLTLNFMGDRPLGAGGRALESMRDITRLFPPIQVAVTGLSVFQNAPPQRSVIYAAIKGQTPKLDWLQGQLGKRLGVLIGRPYVPHITLGVSQPDDARNLADPLFKALMASPYAVLGTRPGATLPCRLIEWTLEKVQLFRSERGEAGPVFTAIGEARLEGQE